MADVRLVGMKSIAIVSPNEISRFLMARLARHLRFLRYFFSSGFGSFGPDIPDIFCARPAAYFSYCALSTVNLPSM